MFVLVDAIIIKFGELTEDIKMSPIFCWMCQSRVRERRAE